MPNMPRWMRPRQYRTPPARGEYETSPHHGVVVTCVHANGRRHIAEPDDDGLFTLPCGLPDDFTLCGTTTGGVCRRLAEHPGRHRNESGRTWPNDGPPA